jgi:glycosyltransferase involved in cell wall biosynthesis
MRAGSGPLVSVCIPVYNGGALVGRAIESCLHQTYSNIEVVVVDNASKDNTKEVVLAYSSRDQRVKYFRNEQAIPIMRNFYETFKRAQGEFVQHLGHDDWLAPNYVEIGVKTITEDPETGGVMPRLISLVVRDGHAVLNNDISLPSGTYSKDYMSRKAPNSKIAGLSLLVFMRRQDVLVAEKEVASLYDHPLYGKLYQGGQGTDWIVFLEVLSHYDHFSFSNNSAFIKTDTARNAGYFFGHDLSKPSGIFQYRDFTRQCLEKIYRERFKDRLSYLRIVLAALAISDIGIGLFKNRFETSYLQDIKLKDARHFFRGYSLKEKVWTVAYSLYLILVRMIQRTASRPISSLRSPSSFFMDSDLNFKI